MLISLNDDELAAVMTAARPLPVKARTEFLTTLARELENQRQLPFAFVAICKSDISIRRFEVRLNVRRLRLRSHHLRLDRGAEAVPPLGPAPGLGIHPDLA